MAEYNISPTYSKKIGTMSFVVLLGLIVLFSIILVLLNKIFDLSNFFRDGEDYVYFVIGGPLSVLFFFSKKYESKLYLDSDKIFIVNTKKGQMINREEWKKNQIANVLAVRSNADNEPKIKINFVDGKCKWVNLVDGEYNRLLEDFKNNDYVTENKIEDKSKTRYELGKIRSDRFKWIIIIFMLILILFNIFLY